MRVVDAGADDPVEALIQLVRDARVGSGLWYATYTLLVYDYLCTFEKEVTYVWTCPWSIGLVLFYLNRYLPFLDFILLSELNATKSEMACKLLWPISLWVLTVGMRITSVILVLRTYAIWGRRRLIFYILAPLIVIVAGTDIVIIGIQSSVTAAWVQNLDSCSFIHWFSLSRLVLIVILTIIKANQHLRQSSSRWVVQLYQNGIIYCIAILLMSLTNAIMAITAPPALKTVFLQMQRNLHSIFCNRVMFLILENRTARRAPEDLDPRAQPLSHAASTMEIFTTVDLYTVDIDENGSDTWQERARREWIR
ncbi:hypothetical protein BDZ97DRAFT_601699 [Flammula alnicola]|nr:hypothetical protein BDZ97DRAFT_601699 [Flammula alnicola]